MDNKEILERLRNDEDYYGEFGKQFLSNSNIYSLLNNPLDFNKPMADSPAFKVGGYLHTCILEPHKLDKFKIIDASTRNTKKYKEISDGEICLLQHEVDKIELMKEKVFSNSLVKELIDPEHCDYEKPGLIELEGLQWKGKADIVNHADRLIIDLKSTSDINKFRWSASKYNYDSQAYIYSKMFGYEFLFVVVDKNTMQLGIYECSEQFLERGANKVAKASQIYKEWFLSENFDKNNYYISEKL